MEICRFGERDEERKFYHSVSSKKVRRHWDDDKEQWYFSIIDAIEILTDSKRPRKYWSDLKKKLFEGGSGLSEKIGQLKMTAPDGKQRQTVLSENGRINKETLLTFLHSKPLLAWSLKPKTGTSYPVIVDNDILNLAIPILPEKT